MLHEAEFPILEFDDALTSVVDTTIFGRDPFSTDKMVITLVHLCHTLVKEI